MGSPNRNYIRRGGCPQYAMERQRSTFSSNIRLDDWAREALGKSGMPSFERET